MMEKENPSRTQTFFQFRRVIPILYAVALVAMAAIVILNLMWKEPNAPDQFGLSDFSKMDSDWYTADGDMFEIAEIDSLRPDGTNTVTIYHSLPDAIEQDETIVFRSKNSTVTVLVDGISRYVSDVAEAPFYNHSPGTRWNFVTIREDDAGKTVELRVTQAYADGRAKVDNFYYGDRAAITVHLIDAKLIGCVISLLILFVALVFLLAWVVLNWHRTPKDHSLLWLALFAITASLWCLLETNVIQFFVRDLRLLQVMDNMMLVLAALPLFLYANSVYGAFRYRIVRILCALDMGYILLATLSQFLGLWDFHQTLNGAVASYGIVAAVLLFCLVKQTREEKSFANKSDLLFGSLQRLGILLLGLGLLGDLIRYLMMDVLDRAFIIRIGLLCFIICFGAGNIYQMILLVKKGLEAEFISQLAYSDGLTKIGNRTAYLERLQRLIEERPGDELGLVMFDVNNLKRVNDTLGHKSGDELLLVCADILQTAFGPPWHVYRIGGDEFMALIHGKEVRAAYETAAARFIAAIVETNGGVERDYSIAIAHGAAFCSVITQTTVDAVEKEADLQMYKNKYQLKLMQ